MSDEKGYQGWTNYETWCVNLWLSNEEPLYRHWRANARDCRLYANTHKHDVWTKEEHARFRLADRMKLEIEDQNPLADKATVWADLVSAALSEVNWSEIAQSWIEGLDE